MVEDSRGMDRQVGERITALEPPKQSSRDSDGLVSEYLGQSIVPILVPVSDTTKLDYYKSLSHRAIASGAGGVPRGGDRLLLDLNVQSHRSTKTHG